LTDKILTGFAEVTKKNAKTHDVWVQPYKVNKDDRKLHQFIFFLKPETTVDTNLGQVLQSVLKRLSEAKIVIGGVRILSGEFLENKNIMGEHYGVISTISRKGVAAISESAKKELSKVYGKEIEAGAKVLGGHELLASYSQLNAFSLRVLNDNLGTQRLGGGTYAFKLNVLGVTHIVLNPFHPYQLVPYTTAGHAIIVFECLSTLPWTELRGDICGATDPAQAKEGSIRQLLLANQKELGLPEVNKSTNGCHMSAGPLEALVELKRFFEIKDDSETIFGQLLADKGLSSTNISYLCSNPTLTYGDKTQSAFDATEEVNSETAAAKLVTSVSKNVGT